MLRPIHHTRRLRSQLERTGTQQLYQRPIARHYNQCSLEPPSERMVKL